MAKRKSTTRSARSQGDEKAVRLQKFLAQAGLGSRRQCEELIVEGRVAIDGQPATELGVRVDPDRQKVEVDGTLVREVRHQYFMLNKPPGVVSTSADPAGRVRVIDLINTDQRVYNVGRLDKSSEGLILVTNDGELANRLTHPRYGIQKTYLVTVNGNPRWDELQLLKRGVRLAEGVARVTDIRIKKRRRKNCELQIVLDEGRNREIRRLLARIGHKVTRLKRVAIGPLHLSDLPVGSGRRLEAAEIRALKRASAKTKTPKTVTQKPVEQDSLERQRRTRKKKGAGGRKKTTRSGGNRATASTENRPSRPGKRRASVKMTRKRKASPAKPLTESGGTRKTRKTARRQTAKKQSVPRARKTPRKSRVSKPR